MSLERQHISGIMIVVALLVNVISFATFNELAIVSGLLYLGSVVFLWNRISARNLLFVKIMLLLAVPGIVLAVAVADIGTLSKFLQGNVVIITLLVSVGMSMQATNIVDQTDGKAKASNGTLGFIITYVGVHFVGAIINYAAILYFGDNIKKRGKFTENHAILLARSFAAAGFWSPLLITMAFALSYSPGANYSEIALYGGLLALTSFIFSLIEFYVQPNKNQYQGIEVSFNEFRKPLIMASIILVLITVFPNIKVLHLVICVSLLFFIYDARKSFVSSIKLNIDKFPNYANEIALFLSAGILNVSLMYLVNQFDSYFTGFILTPNVSTIFLIIAALLTCIGVHPLVSITIFASVVQVSNVTFNLLAFVILTAWAIGSSLGPFSGQNLGIGSRYGINSYNIMKNNIVHSIVLLCVANSIIYIFWIN